MNSLGIAKLLRLAFLVFSISCLGCDAGKPGNAQNADPANRPLSENLQEAVDLFDELKFCISEEAGAQTTKSVVDRMATLLSGIPNSIQASDLSSGDQSKLLAAINQAATACQKPGLDSESVQEALCNELRKPFKSVRKFCSP